MHARPCGSSFLENSPLYCRTRGHFISVFAPWLGWWGAAALSLVGFAIAHIYQGWNGVLRVGIVGAGFTLAVAIFDWLWPAIALHALIDVANGMMAWLTLREGQATEGVGEAGRENTLPRLESR